MGLGEPVATTKTLRRRFLSLAGRITLHLPQHWPWQNHFSSALARLRALPLPLTPLSDFDLSTMTPNAWPITPRLDS